MNRDPVIIPDGRTVNFGSSYAMPSRPRWAGHKFTKWYNTTDSKDFDETSAITKDITLTALWEEGEPEPVDMSLNMDPASWPAPLPANASLTGGTAQYTIPAEYAETAYDSTTKKLTITFNGKNRQRAIIPLSKEQIAELMESTDGVTFRLVGTVQRGEQGSLTNDQIAGGGDANSLAFAGFRLHLGDPSAGSSWNGTPTGLQTPLSEHMVEFRQFDANKKQSTVSWFVIQAMFRDNGGSPDTLPGDKNDPWKETFPKVIITLESVSIDLGDTSAIPLESRE